MPQILKCVFSLLTDRPWPQRQMLYNVTSRLLLVFSPGAKNKKVTLGMRLLWKYIRKSKLVYRKYRCILCYNCQLESIVNSKLKFWGYSEKNMGFQLTPKKVLLPVEPWGMRMQSEHTTLRGYCTPSQFLDCFCIFLKNYNTLVTSKICFL